MQSKYVSERPLIKTLFKQGLTKNKETPIETVSFTDTLQSADEQELSPEHLAPIGPGTTNTWNKKELILSEKHDLNTM